MSHWKCIKCGNEALSKCVNERSIFPGDDFAGLVGAIMDVSFDPDKGKVMYAEGNEDYVRITVSLSITKRKWLKKRGRDQIGFYQSDIPDPKAASPLAALKELRRMLGNKSILRALSFMACKHEWALVGASQCELGHTLHKQYNGETGDVINPPAEY